MTLSRARLLRYNGSQEVPMDAGPGLALAARLKLKLDAAERSEEMTHFYLAQAEGRKRRAALLADLACFGRAVGHLDTREGPVGLLLRRGPRVLHFMPLGQGDVVAVRGSDLVTGNHRLVWHPDHGGWAWGIFHRAHLERYITLFDEGLEELLERALHVPGPPRGHPVNPPRNWVLAPIRREA